MENSYLIIVGEHEEESEELIEYGKSLLMDKVLFLSEKYDKNTIHKKMPPIYNLADVFTMGTLKEAFGIVFIEAMASGVPVIGHNYPVTKWIVGEGGECIDMTQEGELSTTIKKYTNEKHRKKKGEKARERAEKVFSKERVIDDILEMYSQILDRKIHR